jgi:hypothetical protein
VNAPRPTHLRDARLRHALAHAPDAQAAPAEATRAAILRHAHAAVARPAPVAPLPWWARLARALAGPRSPWNAGFATVLVACVVAGLWWERDVPGPAPDAQSPPPAVPTPAPATREATERKEGTAPAEQPATGASAVPQAREKAQPAPRPAQPQPQPQIAPPVPHAEAVAPPAATQSMPPPADVQRRAQAAPPRAEAADAPSAPTPVPAQDPADITASRASRALASGPPRPGAAPAQARPAPATAPDAFAWTALQLQPAPSRARDSLPADVLQAVDNLLRTGATAVPAEDPVLARIALLHEGGAVLGVLELGAYSMRWTPAGDRLPRAFAARVEPATSQRVRDALAP